jgi:hypothetical protein
MPSYFGPVPARLKNVAELSIPFGNRDVPVEIIRRMEKEKREAYNAFKGIGASLYVMFDIPKLQEGREQEIRHVGMGQRARIQGKGHVLDMGEWCVGSANSPEMGSRII